ncbi:hypothetical protein BASA81_000528 [Batrachochytrium salamandrivorans]|nr:hypothetical protein BASA81_000528 [Batrachochytrium salamandrivorans]
MSAPPPVKRAPKGHRQKGAGTMVVSKGPVQRDGLEMKDWQKSPKQLLSEYCKAEKRPMPRYVASGPAQPNKFLLRVILPDPKGQKEKDLMFVPKDAAFDSQFQAEHAVALLALAKLDGPRAHEMKLPEPYKTAWLNLVGRKADTAQAAATTTMAATQASAEAFPCPSCSKSFAKAHALEHHQKKEHPVVAPLLPSVAAQVPVAPKPPPPVITPPMAVSSPPPISDTLLHLQSSSKFASVQERRMANEEYARQTNKYNSNINYNAHNEDEVFMSEDNRQAVEQIIKEARESFDLAGGSGETVPGNDVDSLVNSLAKMGFGKRDARSAFEVGKANGLDSALDWLLLNLDETCLPTAFDPRGMQLEVVKNTATNKPTTAFPSKSASWDVIQTWLDQDQPRSDNGEEDWDTLVAILGEDQVIRTKVLNGQVELLRIKVGVNPNLHATEEISLELIPSTRQFLVRGLGNDTLANRCTQQLYEEMIKQVLPGEPCAYFLWDYCRTMSKPLLVNTTNTKPGKVADQQPEKSKPKERTRQVRPVDKQEVARQNLELSAHLLRRPVMASRSHLPASKFRDEIITAVTNHSVVILKGETGCGKTTQVPQFVFEHLISIGQGGTANIIVTQPRRLAAISVAQRVADEFGGKIGEEIGYRVQLDSKVNPKLTRVEFCTTGLLLRRLEFEGNALPVTHIFVDEIHERSLDSDFLLAMLKHQVLRRRPEVKIILMSATMDAQRFSTYFGGAPVLQIPGRTFPVQEVFLEDLPVQRNHDSDYYHFVAQCILQAHREIPNAEGSILVFVSGVNEINRTINACQQQQQSSGEEFLLLLGLHGGSPTGQNNAVFARSPKGKRKVVVCTNVCETSITIPDCVLVIDTGKAKEIRYDGENKFSSLEEDWISQANANQRKGRAGRVQAGVCWKLFSKHKQLLVDQLAEVHRVPLDNIVLSVAHHLRHDDRGDLLEFFTTLIEPPATVNVQGAIDTLVDINALEPKSYRLTPLGEHLVKLPMDVQLGKLLIYGSLLSVPRELAICTAALCRSKSLFLPDGNRKRFENASQSDHIAAIAAFEQWEQSKQRKQFCEEHGLDAQVLREISGLVSEFLSNLDRIGFASKPIQAATSDMNRRKRIKACLCVLSPSVLRIRKPQKRYVQMSGGAFETEDYDPKEIKFYSLRASSSSSAPRVFIHPSSVNFSSGMFYSNFMVYSSLMQTSKLFAQNCTCVSPYGLILFASTEVTMVHDTGALVCDNGKMTFKCNPRVGVLLREIKKLLDALLRAKIEDEQAGSSLKVMEACTKLIEGDGFSN